MKIIQNKILIGICDISQINSKFLNLCYSRELKFDTKILKNNFQMMKYYRVIAFFPKPAIHLKAWMKKKYLKIFRIVIRIQIRITVTVMTMRIMTTRIMTTRREKDKKKKKKKKKEIMI